MLRIRYTVEERRKRFFMAIAIIIPLIFIGYVLINNFVLTKNFVYLYDIGSADDMKKPYLTPIERVSDAIPATGEEPDYREIMNALVYFDVPVPMGAGALNIEMKFRDNFPENSRLRIGTKNSDIWNYTYEDVYFKNKSKGNETAGSDWIISYSSFALNETYIKDGKLNMLINIPHLGKNATQGYKIAIDWINITVHKDGII